MNNEDEHKRALIFLERKTLVHISTNRDNNFWCNGIILEVGGDFFIIKDREGGKEHIIFFSELNKPLESFKEKEEWNQKKKQS